MEVDKAGSTADSLQILQSNGGRLGSIADSYRYSTADSLQIYSRVMEVDKVEGIADSYRYSRVMEVDKVGGRTAEFYRVMEVDRAGDTADSLQIHQSYGGRQGRRHCRLLQIQHSYG